MLYIFCILCLYFSVGDSVFLKPTCSNSANYTTWNKGVRKIYLPSSYCSGTFSTEQIDLIHSLCCANTHLICRSDVTAPFLVSYDNTSYNLSGTSFTTANTDAYNRICAMRMAKDNSDCSPCSVEKKSKSKVEQVSDFEQSKPSDVQSGNILSILRVDAADHISLGGVVDFLIKNGVTNENLREGFTDSDADGVRLVTNQDPVFPKGVMSHYTIAHKFDPKVVQTDDPLTGEASENSADKLTGKLGDDFMVVRNAAGRGGTPGAAKGPGSPGKDGPGYSMSEWHQFIVPRDTSIYWSNAKFFGQGPDPYHRAGTIAFLELMKEATEEWKGKVMKENPYIPENSFIFGFHTAPDNSLMNLHLHCVAGKPNPVAFGVNCPKTVFSSLDTIIAKLKKKPDRQVANDEILSFSGSVGTDEANAATAKCKKMLTTYAPVSHNRRNMSRSPAGSWSLLRPATNLEPASARQSIVPFFADTIREHPRVVAFAGALLAALAAKYGLA